MILGRTREVKSIFIAGTDTGVGKTMVTGMLADYLLENDRTVITQKWIQVGCGRLPRDIDTHLKLMKRRREDFEKYLPLMTPYLFKLAASPHLAARRDKRSISVDRIKRSFASLTKDFDTVLVEGTGGVLVPVNETMLLIDIVRELGLPVLLVAGNKLGAINHTLLSIEALRSRGIKVAGLIFNNISKGTERSILKDNPRIVEILTKMKVLGVLPYARGMGLMQKKFAPIGERIVSLL